MHIWSFILLFFREDLQPESTTNGDWHICKALLSQSNALRRSQDLQRHTSDRLDTDSSHFLYPTPSKKWRWTTMNDVSSVHCKNWPFLRGTRRAVHHRSSRVNNRSSPFRRCHCQLVRKIVLVYLKLFISVILEVIVRAVRRWPRLRRRRFIRGIRLKWWMEWTFLSKYPRDDVTSMKRASNASRDPAIGISRASSAPKVRSQSFIVIARWWSNCSQSLVYWRTSNDFTVWFLR